jgi:hypothetical protein
MLNPSLTPHNPNMGKLYDDDVYCTGDPTGFHPVRAEGKKWNPKMKYGNDRRYHYVIERTQDDCSAMLINQNIQRWRMNHLSTLIGQAEGIIRCIIVLLAITRTLDESARDYYNEKDTSARARFNDWNTSHE